MDVIINGFMSAFNISAVMYVILGVFTGLSVGAIPGLSGPMAIALAVPLTYTMNPVAAIGFLIGINKGSCYGGSISAILLNTPGSAEAAATTYDGYPLTQQGKGMKAIKLSLVSSVFGDTFSTLLLICVAAPIAGLALKMGPSEVLALILFALAMIAALESDSLAKGLLAAAFGMMLSTVGMDPVVGQPRLTFEIFHLESGLRLVGIAIGLLAMSEMIVQTEAMKKGGKNKAAEATITMSPNPEDNRLSWKEFKSCIGTLFRSSGIGAVIGALPGLGAAVAPFIAYGAAKNSSKNPEEFGKGSLQGIAAPESSNNAVIGAALIPLFTLGIPGSLAAALLVGVFIMHGVQVGPLMFEQQGEMVYGIYGTMLIGNVALLFIGYLGIKIFTKILGLPKMLLLPLIMYVCMVGAYMDDQSIFAISSMLCFAIIGVIMRRLRFSFVCFVVGFILGPMLELSLQQTMIAFNGEYLKILTRPVTIVTTLGMFIFLGLQFYAKYKRNKACNI